MPSRSTYARQLDAAVTALGGSAALLDVQDAELAAGGLNDTSLVRRRVVAIAMPMSVDCSSSSIVYYGCAIRVDLHPQCPSPRCSIVVILNLYVVGSMKTGVWMPGKMAKKRFVRMGSIISLRTRCGDGKRLCCWPFLLFDVVGDGRR